MCNLEKDLGELKRAYEKYQTSDKPEDLDKFVRVCEKILT